MGKISGTFWGHNSGLFWVLLTGNTVIALLGTSQRKFWMSHSGKFWILSLEKLWMFPWCSWWKHPGHMIWNTANVLAIFWPRDWEHSEWTAQENSGYFLWENLECSHSFPDGNILVTSPGTLWMYWPFPDPGKLQGNWLGIFWMNLQCTRWVFAWYFVHVLVMDLWCTSTGHHPLPPVNLLLLMKRRHQSFFTQRTAAFFPFHQRISQNLGFTSRRVDLQIRYGHHQDSTRSHSRSVVIRQVRRILQPRLLSSSFIRPLLRVSVAVKVTTRRFLPCHHRYRVYLAY